MKTDEIIKVIEDLFELFDKNDIVRNIDKDFDFKFFIEQGLRIFNVLSKLESIKSEFASLREKDEGEPGLREELICPKCKEILKYTNGMTYDPQQYEDSKKLSGIRDIVSRQFSHYYCKCGFKIYISMRKSSKS